MRTPTGGNTTNVLAAAAVAQTALSIATSRGDTGSLSGLLIASVLIAFVFALAVADKEAGFLLTIVGIAAQDCVDTDLHPDEAQECLAATGAGTKELMHRLGHASPARLSSTSTPRGSAISPSPKR